jgi:hypothetical protein
MRTDGVQIWTNEGSVTCLPRLEPPSKTGAFCGCSIRFCGAQFQPLERSSSFVLTPPFSMAVGFFVSEFVQHPLPDQLLHTGKSAEVADAAVLTSQ